MTVKQKQCLLCFLGFYDGLIDGIWGPKSKAATEKFQGQYKGLEVTGTADEQTQKALRDAVAYGMPQYEAESGADSGDFWQKVKYFTREEFACLCGGKYCDGFPVEPAERLVLALDEFRERLGVPVYIVDANGSGVRCVQHNANVGGALNSQHLYGLAADLHSSKSPEEMYRVAEEVLGDAGGIGIYNWGIHFDMRPEKARWDER